jgi:hypothetical protein
MARSTRVVRTSAAARCATCGPTRAATSDRRGQNGCALRVFVDIGNDNPVAVGAVQLPGRVELQASAAGAPGVGDPGRRRKWGDWLAARSAAERCVRLPGRGGSDEIAYRLDHPARPGLSFVLDLRWSACSNQAAGAPACAACWAAAGPDGEIFPRPIAVFRSCCASVGALSAAASEDPDLVDLLCAGLSTRSLPLAGSGFAAENGAATPRPSRLATRS